MRSSHNITEYQINICAEELLCTKNAGFIVSKPHVKMFLESKFGILLTSFIQNFIWTSLNAFDFFKSLALLRRDCTEEYIPITDNSIYIDVTSTWAKKSTGGIARVSKKIAEASLQSKKAVPVFLKDAKLLTCDKSPKIVSLKETDTYIIVDCFWYPFADYQRTITSAKNIGAKVVVCIHDIIPLQFPALMAENFEVTFAACMPWIVENANTLFTVSRASAFDIESYCNEANLKVLSNTIHVVKLGSNAVLEAKGSIRSSFKTTLDFPKTFISVGTLMPHKGQILAIKAFTQLWNNNCDFRYVIIGKADKAFLATVSAILKNPFYGTRLFWVQDSNDAELDFAYSAAHCLIQPSIAEGYGIPVAEALARGLRVLASDIPVFQEVGENNFTFFRVGDIDDLAAKIIDVGQLDVLSTAKYVRPWDAVLDDIIKVATN